MHRALLNRPSTSRTRRSISAEKFQIPAFVLSDQYLADSQWSYEGLDLDKTVYRDYRLRDVPPDAARRYRRYAYTASGVSPLAVPGQSECLVVDDSDEHDEEGHIIEDSQTRTQDGARRGCSRSCP